VVKPLAEPKAELAIDAAGLSNAEAGSRLAKFGPNLFRDHQERPLFVQFLARFKNPLAILLLMASAISAFTGEITNFVIISVMVLFVPMANALQHKPWLESFLFAVALAVGLTPKLLPMVVSVTLSRGALHLAKKRVIVKRLASITDLGSMDVLCTDKTGTLTEAKIRLEQHVDPQGKPTDLLWHSGRHDGDLSGDSRSCQKRLLQVAWGTRLD